MARYVRLHVNFAILISMRAIYVSVFEESEDYIPTTENGES